MALVTLQQLIDGARSRADMPIPGFVSNAEVTDWLNEGLKQLHTKLVDAYEKQYAYAEQVFNTVAGQTDYALPVDFFRLYGIDFLYTGRSRTLKPYNEAERNAYKNRSWASFIDVPSYSFVRIAGAAGIRLLPAPPVGTGTILYAPVIPTLVVGTLTGTVELPDSWEKYAKTYAAIQMLNKEESSVTALKADIATWDKELQELKDTRDMAFPKQTTDVEKVDLDALGWP